MSRRLAASLAVALMLLASPAMAGEVALAHKGLTLNAQLELTDGKRVRMKVVESADHFFRDLFTDDAVESIDTFLKAMPK